MYGASWDVSAFWAALGGGAEIVAAGEAEAEFLAKAEAVMLPPFSSGKEGNDEEKDEGKP